MPTLFRNNNEKHLGGKEESSSTDLESIVNECAQTKGTWGLIQNDIMFAVTFWSMLSSGFISSYHSESKKAGNKTGFLPKGWKHDSKSLYEAKFGFPPYLNHTIRLIALPIDDVLCINAIVSNMSPRSVSLRSLAVNSSKYVLRFGEKRISLKFSALEEFNLQLRNAIIWPIRCSILTDEGIMNGSLSGLSDEIKLKIFSYLQVKELSNLSQTCRDLYRICNDQGLWKLFYHQNFKNSCKCSVVEATKDCDENCDWKENYKHQHALKNLKKASEESSNESFHTPQETPFGEFDFDID